MIDHTYLQKGLLATARSHQAGSMAGHLGASVLAGYYLGEDYPDLPKAVMKGIQGELQRIIQGEETLWTSIGKTGIGARELFAEAGDGEFLESPQGDPEDMVHGLKTLQQHLEYYLVLPDLTDELGFLQRASVDPRQSAYWQGSYRQSSQWSGWLTHRIKTMHGFYQLRESLNEDRLRQACDHAFLYLMA